MIIHQRRGRCPHCGQSQVMITSSGEPHGRHLKSARCERASKVRKLVCERRHQGRGCESCRRLIQLVFTRVAAELGEAALFTDSIVDVAMQVQDPTNEGEA